MQLPIPQAIQTIYDQLLHHGYEAYFVGGCVRDAYMGNVVSDYDVATSATCEEMLQIYQEPTFKVILTGVKHGTLCVIHEHERVEITTYRSDGSYENHRSPTQVIFTRSLHEDLLRRDFTMNAMAYGMGNDFIDEMGGCHDIEHKLIRCVGDPNRRFQEDALRILRCLRFAHRFQFDIEASTKQACCTQLPLLYMISIERVRDELFKMLMDKQPNILDFLNEFGIIQCFLPEIKQNKTIDNFNTLPLKLACLFPTSQLAYNVLKRLHCDNQLIAHVCLLISHQSACVSTNRLELRHLLHECHNDFQIVREIISMKQSDQEEILKLLTEMEKEDDFYDLKKLAIHGDDLLAQGYHGPIMKTILNDCLMLVLNDPTMNQKMILINYLKTNYQQ